MNSLEPAAKKGNLINAKCALAAPPHYLPLVEPLRPGPISLGGAPAPPSTLPPPLLSIPLPLPLALSRTLPCFSLALLPAARLLSLLLAPPALLPPSLPSPLCPSACVLSALRAPPPLPLR